jgi:predicted ATPase/transcriptional regulator with XRE-family HTH domain
VSEGRDGPVRSRRTRHEVESDESVAADVSPGDDVDVSEIANGDVAGGQTLGAALRRFRSRARLTQEELAERSGVSVRTIRNLESDRPSSPRWSSVRALADALELDAEERVRFDRLAGLDDGRTAAARGGGSIPVPLSRLVGRDVETTKLADVVLDGTTRLVTLTGVAGIGKTRLALAVAQVASRRGRRSWWVPLAGVVESRYVLDAVAGALGVSEVTVEAITTRVGGAPALLVVDNLEHLDGVAGVLTDLLGRVPEVTALVTSRAPVGVADEQVWPVRPLPVPAGDDDGVEEVAAVASVELLVDRVRRTTPAFELNADTAGVVVDVCRRLDGLPLALELAAGAWRVLGATGVLEAICADPLEVRDVQGARPAAHRSLRNALDASYRLLGDETQEVLHMLSVFRGGWRIEAAAAIVGGGSVLDHLDRLAALGLVETHDDTSGRRFSMLPTIQTFAGARARDAGVLERTRARHADFFRRWVAEMHDSLDAASEVVHQRIQADGDNVRAALEWFARHDAATGLNFAIDVYRYWLFRGSMDEGVDWFDTMLRRAGDVERAPFAQLFAASLANYGGRPPTEARRLAEQSLETYRRRGDARGMALATGVLADIDLRGDVAASVRRSQEAVATLEAIGDSFNVRWALSILAFGQAQLGDLAGAESTARRMVAVAREQDNPYRLAAALRTLAIVLRLKGDLADADRFHAESDPLMSGLDDLHLGAQWQAEWAVVAAGVGDLDRARELSEDAVAKASLRADSMAMGVALWAEGEVRLATGAPAVESFVKALTSMGRNGLSLRRVEALVALAFAVDDADVAATAIFAAIAIRDEQHVVFPASVAARLDEIRLRWTSIIGLDQWNRRMDELAARPDDELLDLLIRTIAARPGRRPGR